MAHPAVTEFLQKFLALKSKVNGNPNNVAWMATESPEVESLVWGMYLAWRQLAKFLATSPTKSISRVPNTFRGAFQEFESRWNDQINKATDNALVKVIEHLDEIIEELPQDTKEELDRPDFDPVRDDPAELVDTLLWYAVHRADDEGDVGDDHRLGLQAWDYFANTIGLNLTEVARRWRLIQSSFVPEHVANAYGVNDPDSLYELLNQVVRAYVFGASTAAIDMFRSLTELICKRR